MYRSVRNLRVRIVSEQLGVPLACAVADETASCDATERDGVCRRVCVVPGGAEGGRAAAAS